jgi:hypothetical protein
MNGFVLKRELSMRHRSLPVIKITARAEPGIEEKRCPAGDLLSPQALRGTNFGELSPADSQSLGRFGRG